MKLYKKIAMYALVATLSLGTFGVLSLSAKGANGDYDGDIITNPWHELFTTTSNTGDLPVDETTTSNTGDLPVDETTTHNRGDLPTVVPTKNNNHATTKKNDTKVKVKATAVKSAKKSKKAAKIKISLKKVKGATDFKKQKIQKSCFEEDSKENKFYTKEQKIKEQKEIVCKSKSFEESRKEDIHKLMV